MTDDTTRRDEDDLVPDPMHDTGDLPPEAPDAFGESEPLTEAEQAEAEEAEAAAAEEMFDEGDDAFDAEAVAQQAQEAMGEAQYEGLRARASWALLHKELLVLLFANCLFFAGVLVAWERFGPWDETLHVAQAQTEYTQAQENLKAAQAAFDANAGNSQKIMLDQAMIDFRLAGVALDKAADGPRHVMNGLDTIRGALLFALALFGFWIFWLNVRYRQLVVWPFLLNALLALWVGIPGFTRAFGSERMAEADRYVENLASKTLLDKVTVPLTTIPPGHWLLTFAGALVLVVLLKGVISGASSAGKKGRPARSGSGERSRRR